MATCGIKDIFKLQKMPLNESVGQLLCSYLVRV